MLLTSSFILVAIGFLKCGFLKKTTFMTHWRCFDFHIMPSQLTNCQAIFHEPHLPRSFGEPSHGVQIWFLSGAQPIGSPLNGQLLKIKLSYLAIKFHLKTLKWIHQLFEPYWSCHPNIHRVATPASSKLPPQHSQRSSLFIIRWSTYQVSLPV